MPGTGELLITAEDGYHAHEMADGEKTESDGRHVHQTMLANGSIVTTKLGGDHAHTLMAETTNFDGNHTHILRLKDGTELVSLTISEYVAWLGFDPVTTHLAPASEILRALSDARWLRETLDEMMTPTLDEAVCLVAQGASADVEPTFLMEVADIVGDTIRCEFTDGVSETFEKSIEVEHGDVVEVRDDAIVAISKSLIAMTSEQAKETIDEYVILREAVAKVEFTGPEDAPLIFVAGSPDPLEVARGEPLVGEYGETFEKRYLSPLRLEKKDVAIGFVVPVQKTVGGFDYEKTFEPWLAKQLARYPKAVVVALGKAAREALGDRARVSLPHPRAVTRNGDSGEIVRKMRALADDLDKAGVLSVRFIQLAGHPRTKGSGTLAADTSGTRKNQGPYEVGISKSAVEKQIVYGVVLDPYQVDAHNDWIPPAEIETTAHGFLKKSRVIGLDHMEQAKAEVVESSIVPYPSGEDYRLAMENKPHRVIRQKFGSDTIHSGAWVIGVQLGDDEWAAHKSGKLNAFSIGGFSFKTKVSVEEMPSVEFVDLVAS